MSKKSKKKELESQLSHVSHLEGRAQHSQQGFETRVAHTNIKVSQNQIKHGKHKNVGEYGHKGDQPLA